MCTGNKKEKHFCRARACERKAFFGFNRARWCKNHKKSGMKNHYIRRCEVDECVKFPSWGFPGRRSSRCTQHALQGMISSKPICATTDCLKFACYGNKDGPAEMCFTHKLPNMKNVVSPRCPVEGCDRIAIKLYGYHCVHHKSGPKKPLCASGGCNRNAAYAAAVGDTPVWCGHHKQKDMVNVVRKLCRADGCYRIAIKMHNDQCKHHYLQPSDATKIQCDKDGCTHDATYGTAIGEIPLRCAKHRTPRLVNVFRKLCDVGDCVRVAVKLYGNKCYLHKDELKSE